jgi:hypothetical protein
MYRTIFFIIIFFHLLMKKNKTYDSKIPKIIFQTSKDKIPSELVNKIINNAEGWNYTFFSDEDIIDFFNKNHLEEFPKIIDKFRYLKNGSHKADLFRYYYLYIKGGVFIDSDAVLEKNIDFIVKDYDFVSVKSIVPNTLFNGFIATKKKNSIIYNSLKLLYKTSNEELDKDYHLVCKQFMDMYLKHKNKKSILLSEYHDRNFDNICVKTYDENNINVLTHFSWCKNISKNFRYSYIFDYE